MHIGASQGDTVKRRNPDETSVDVSSPPPLPDYQQYMKGVDRGDQLVGYYNIGWRSKKWWKKFFHMLYSVCIAECLLFRKDLEPEVHNASVRGRRKRDVAEQLIESHTLHH